MADVRPPASDIDTSYAHAITPTIALASQAASIFAIYFGASHSLKRWIAASSLQPPPLEERPVVETPPRKGWAKFFNKDTALIAGRIAILATIQYFAHFVVPKIKSRAVINTFWLTLMMVCLVASSEGLIRVCIPSQNSLSIIEWKTANKPTYLLKSVTTRHKAWIVVPIAMAVAEIMSSFFGAQIAIPMIAFTWTATCIAFFAPPKLNTKFLILILNGYLVGVLIIVPLIGAVTALFTSDKGDGKEKEPNHKDDVTLPSIWIFRIMLTIAFSIPAVMPGLVLAMAYRFDHLISHLAAGPGEAVVVPSSVAPLPKPTFYAGLFALAISLLGIKVVDITMLGLPNGTETLYMFITLPVVTLAMIGSAWSRGQLREFWTYSEHWVPQVEDTPKVKVDVEAAPGVETNNEKDPLLQAKA